MFSGMSYATGAASALAMLKAESKLTKDEQNRMMDAANARSSKRMGKGFINKCMTKDQTAAGVFLALCATARKSDAGARHERQWFLAAHTALRHGGRLGGQFAADLIRKALSQRETLEFLADLKT